MQVLVSTRDMNEDELLDKSLCHDCKYIREIWNDAVCGGTMEQRCYIKAKIEYDYVFGKVTERYVDNDSLCREMNPTGECEYWEFHEV